MSDISISRDHSLTFDDLKTRIYSLLDKYQEKYPIKEVIIDWEGNIADFKVKVMKVTINGKFIVFPETVKFSLKLSWYMRGIKDRIQNRLEIIGDELVA